MEEVHFIRATNHSVAAFGMDLADEICGVPLYWEKTARRKCEYYWLKIQSFSERSIATGLRRAGYALDVSGDGEEGLWFARSNDYDVIILDLMLPGLDGLTMLRRLRDAGKSTHVLILTARDTVEDRVLGLRSGSDDYLVKPFAFDELLARVQSLARRAHGVKTALLRVADLEIDTSRRIARRGATPLELPPREFALLEYLAMRQGRLVTRPEIEAHIYDDRIEPASNVIESAIYTLRKRIDLPGAPSLIQTRRGMGYVLQAVDE